MNKKLQEHYKVSRLITKNLLGEASEEEKRQLQEWLEASPSHQREYAQWVKRLQHDLSQDEPSPYAAWKVFNQRMHPQRSRFLRTSYLYAYAAVLVVAVLFGGLAYFH